MYSIAKLTYRRLLPIGEYQLDRMLHDGLPEGFRRPLHYLLTKSLNHEDRAVVEKIESLRAAMAEREDACVAAYPSPAPGSAGTEDSPTAKPAPGIVRKVPLKYIADTTSALPYWGAFLYLCAGAAQAHTILELGGCAGISGCYLASGKHCYRFITVEGSSDLAGLARSNIRQVRVNAEVVNALFDEALDEVLPTLNANLDMVHIDGQHEKIATFHYLQRVIPHLNAGCVLVFDDIRWTPDMWETWQSLCKRKGFAWTLDVGRHGLALWDGATEQPKNYEFSRFTDLWKHGKPLVEVNAIS